jgi:hypothetical protein
MKRTRPNPWRRTITPEIVGAVLDLQSRAAVLYAVLKPAPAVKPQPLPKLKPARVGKLPPPAQKARKADVMTRAKADRAARELERPVDALPGMKPEPFVHATPAQAAPIIAAIVAKRAFTPPPNPLEERRARLQRAIDFLNTRAWFVQIVNRDAAVRTYRVAGKRDAMLAEDVIRVAIEKGMEP